MCRKRLFCVDAGSIVKFFLFFLLVFFPLQEALAERIFFAGYKCFITTLFDWIGNCKTACRNHWFMTASMV